MKLERRMIKGLVALLVVLPLVSCGGAGNIEGGLDSSGTSVSADAAASDASADSGTTSSTSTLASRRSRTSTSSTSGTTTTTTSSGTTGGTTTTTTSSGTTGSSSGVLWTDGIQAGTAENWGFDYMMTESPIGTSVKPSDANGANISRVADPLGGAGYALRFYTDFSRSADGVRAEVDLLSQSNTAFAAQAKSTKGIWVAQEWYFPQALSAGNDDYPWLNLWVAHFARRHGREGRLDEGPVRLGGRVCQLQRHDRLLLDCDAGGQVVQYRNALRLVDQHGDSVALDRRSAGP
jgi:hypothetical protein